MQNQQEAFGTKTVSLGLLSLFDTFLTDELFRSAKIKVILGGKEKKVGIKRKEKIMED